MQQEGTWHVAEQMGQQAQLAWGLKLQPGFNDRIQFMAHLQDTLQCHYRPMTFYLLGELLAAVKHAMLLAQGFRCVCERGAEEIKRRGSSRAVGWRAGCRSNMFCICCDEIPVLHTMVF